MISLVGFRSLLLLASSLALACGDGESPPSHSMPPGRAPTYDAGVCGLSFAEAVEAYAPERVCQTWVYRAEQEDCAHWAPCSQ